MERSSRSWPAWRRSSGASATPTRSSSCGSSATASSRRPRSSRCSPASRSRSRSSARPCSSTGCCTAGRTSSGSRSGRWPARRRVGALVSGFAIRVLPLRLVSLVGLGASAGALFAMGGWTSSVALTTVSALLALFGLGFGLTVTPRSTAAVEAAGPARVRGRLGDRDGRPDDRHGHRPVGARGVRLDRHRPPLRPGLQHARRLQGVHPGGAARPAAQRRPRRRRARIVGRGRGRPGDDRALHRRRRGDRGGDPGGPRARAAGRVCSAGGSRPTHRRATALDGAVARAASVPARDSRPRRRAPSSRRTMAMPRTKPRRSRSEHAEHAVEARRRPARARPSGRPTAADAPVLRIASLVDGQGRGGRGHRRPRRRPSPDPAPRPGST